MLSFLAPHSRLTLGAVLIIGLTFIYSACYQDAVAQECSNPEGQAAAGGGGVPDPDPNPDPSATPASTPLPETMCINMSTRPVEDAGVAIVQSGSIDSCMPDIIARLTSAEDGVLARECLDDMTAKTVAVDCGEIDDWMWYYWMRAMPVEGVSEWMDAETLTGTNPWDDGGITLALNLKGDGTCTINGPLTQSGACSAPDAEKTELVIIAEPISLIWEAEKQDSSVFALFPLDLQNPGKFFHWQASGSKPLLVHDPEHRGKITSATQLFGNWTFGGKQVASADFGRLSDAFSPSLGLPWKDGYEALATLDINGDRKLSGTELEPLALWFDYNRDAVSQEGEVKRLDSVGVDLVYVTPDGKDAVTGDILASRGFERVLDGGIRKTGASVDWMAKGYDSPAHIAAFETAPPTGITGQSEPGAPQYTNDGIASYAGGTSVSGIWQWKVSAIKGARIKRPEAYKGLLLIKSNQGKLEGGTVIETPTNNGARTAALQIIKVHGRTELNRRNEVVLKFETALKNKPKTLNEAYLVDDMHMEGVSKVEIGKDKLGKPIIMSYSWTAQKLLKRSR